MSNFVQGNTGNIKFYPAQQNKVATAFFSICERIPTGKVDGKTQYADQWHSMVAFGRTAERINMVGTGVEIVVLDSQNQVAQKMPVQMQNGDTVYMVEDKPVIVNQFAVSSYSYVRDSGKLPQQGQAQPAAQA